MSSPEIHTTEGHIPKGAKAAFSALRQLTSERNIPLEDSAGRLSTTIWETRLTLDARGEDALISLAGQDQRLLQVLQDTVSTMQEELGLRVNWSNVAEGALAPGLSLMTVSSVIERSPGYLRVRVSHPEASRFNEGGLHFRLLIPPHDREPKWPTISASGRTLWPEGDDKIHKPVYTVIETGDGWLDFDVFNHEGSPTCDYFRGNPIGETVGIMGPGGGMCPEGSPLLLFGDETSWPAILRMLALAEGEVRAFVTVCAQDLGPYADDPRVNRVESLLDALSDCSLPEGGFVWVAGHKDTAQAARAQLLKQGLPKTAFVAAAYWT